MILSLASFRAMDQLLETVERWYKLLDSTVC